MIDTEEIAQVINRDPEIMSGAPVFKGTRVPLEILFDHLEDGYTLNEVLDAFPSVSRDQAITLLKQVEKIDNPRIVSRNPDIMGGTPVFPNTRVPVIALADYFEADDSIDTFVDHFPTVKRAQIVTLLECLQKLALTRLPVPQVK